MTTQTADGGPDNPLETPRQIDSGESAETKVAKRNVIILANCQGWVLQTGLRGHAPDLKGTHTVVMHESFKPLPANFPELAAATDFYIFQHEVSANVQQSDKAIREHLPASARIVRIPAAGFAPLWPSFMRDFHAPKDARYPSLKYGPLQWKDRFLERWLREGLPHDEIIDRWLAFDLVEATKIDRLLELWTIKQQQLEAECNVGFSDIVLSVMSERQLFFWPEHPATFLLMNLADRVLGHLGMSPMTPDAYNHKDYLKDYELPVHPSIARHFNMKWVTEDRIYLGAWGEKVTLRGFLNFYLEYSAEMAARKIAEGQQASG